MRFLRKKLGEIRLVETCKESRQDRIPGGVPPFLGPGCIGKARDLK